MNNVAQHAGTMQAWVRLHHDASGLRLEVEDHGRGVSPGGRRGLGLITMRERADLVGGTIEFQRPGGGGTLVRFTVPAPSGVPA